MIEDIQIWADLHNLMTLSGETTEIKPSVKIDIQGACIIGGYCMIADDVIIYTHTHEFKRANWQDLPIKRQITQIGDHVFIGARSIILGGVWIAPHCVIGAGSVVTKSINEPYTIWGGNPAKKIGEMQHDPA